MPGRLAGSGVWFPRRRTTANPGGRRRYRDGVGRYFYTTPIYYVNDVPHMGHAYTTLNGDALARWRRMHGDEVFYLTGTDEHGLKVQRAAEQNGLSPQEQADRTSKRFKEAWDLLDIAYDDFIRTTEPRHHTAVQTLLKRCYENGYVYKDTYQGAYCVACEAYYAEADLVDGNCPIHGVPVEQMTEDNYFFRLSAFRDRLLEWFEDVPDNITPERYRNEARALVRGRPRGPVDHPHLAAVGDPRAVGPQARLLRVGTTPSPTTPPRPATAPTTSASPRGGPPAGTCSARTSSDSTACTGRPC